VVRSRVTTPLPVITTEECQFKCSCRVHLSLSFAEVTAGQSFSTTAKIISETNNETDMLDNDYTMT